MKKLSTNISSVWPSNSVLLFCLIVGVAHAFQTEFPASPVTSSGSTPFETIEAGLATEKNNAPSYYYMASGDYSKALDALSPDVEAQAPWLRDYLYGLTRVFQPLERSESEHFIVWTPPGQKFLADYALPTLEQAAAHIEKTWKHRPNGKIRVEIYPTKEDFSAASTLSLETLERSGAIGICKFHRLMIMSPKSLPLGYRWLDALSHEYTHLIVNELSHSKAELWLHEGTARYFETSYRLDPPVFLTPDQKTKLMEALEKKTLVTFARMSPSMVYLKDREEVSLAFAEVSHALSLLIRERGIPTFTEFLISLRKDPFRNAFTASYRMSPDEFEKWWQGKLADEKWEKSRGTLSDEVRFHSFSEEDVIGADVQGLVRLGDRMRGQGLPEAALIEYDKALKEEPDNAIVLLKAAKTHVTLNQFEKAVERLRRATEKNPNYGTPHLELAQLAGPHEALPHLIEANAINPFDPRIHKLLSEIYEKAGRGEESRKENEIYEQLIRF